MPAFNIGDVVECISPPDFADRYVGMSGVVVNIDTDNTQSLTVCVRFDDEYDIWWCEEHSLVLQGVSISKEEKVLRKMKKLWNRSNFVQEHSKLAY